MVFFPSEMYCLNSSKADNFNLFLHCNLKLKAISLHTL